MKVCHRDTKNKRLIYILFVKYLCLVFWFENQSSSASPFWCWSVFAPTLQDLKKKKKLDWGRLKLKTSIRILIHQPDAAKAVKNISSKM